MPKHPPKAVSDQTDELLKDPWKQLRIDRESRSLTSQGAAQGNGDVEAAMARYDPSGPPLLCMGSLAYEGEPRAENMIG